ncbi:MAG: plasmid pRiA4b ORF-3 family protein [Cyclobacteriaceae bacterium]|nr:plasmid pRiA4b ORF-3 family protein [Cyclobacteriaceae bacterium]
MARGKFATVLPEKTSLEKEFQFLRSSRPFYYTYDFGDNWTHKITFLKIGVADLEVFSGVPLLVEASGACPPEDVGGPWGYENFLEALSDREAPGAQGLC